MVSAPIFPARAFSALIACAATPDPLMVSEGPPVWRFELAAHYQTQGVDAEGGEIAALVPYAEQQDGCGAPARQGGRMAAASGVLKDVHDLQSSQGILKDVNP